MNHSSSIRTYTSLEYRPAAGGVVALYADGESVRTAVRGVGSTRSCDVVAAALNTALREGAAYGPINNHQELARLLLDQPDPAGRVRYDLTLDRVITRAAGGVTTRVQVPALRTNSALAEFARELGDAFDIGGTHPAAVPAVRVAHRTHTFRLSYEMALNMRSERYVDADRTAKAECTCGWSGYGDDQTQARSLAKQHREANQEV